MIFIVQNVSKEVVITVTDEFSHSEVVEALFSGKVDVACRLFKKHNGKVVVASSMELKAKDISCSGWEVRRDRMV